MDDIMILFNKIVVDLVSFDETQFGIFKDSEQKVLIEMFTQCGRSSPKFLSLLSPDQKRCVAIWACARTSYPVDELSAALKKFVTYLDGAKFTTYPKDRTTKPKKALMNRAL